MFTSKLDLKKLIQEREINMLGRPYQGFICLYVNMCNDMTAFGSVISVIDACKRIEMYMRLIQNVIK